MAHRTIWCLWQPVVGEGPNRSRGGAKQEQRRGQTGAEGGPNRSRGGAKQELINPDTKLVLICGGAATLTLNRDLDWDLDWDLSWDLDWDLNRELNRELNRDL